VPIENENETTDAPEKKGCILGFLASLFGGKEAVSLDQAMPYRGRDYLFSKAERSFYEVLVRSLPQGHVLFAKVRLADLLYLAKGTEKSQSWRNRIQSKHVDFVICEPKYLKPILVVELDDSSHDEPDRQDRDRFVDKALGAGGIAILHVPAKSAYIPAEIAKMVSEKINQKSNPT